MLKSVLRDDVLNNSKRIILKQNDENAINYYDGLSDTEKINFSLGGMRMYGKRVLHKSREKQLMKAWSNMYKELQQIFSHI